MEAAGSFSPTLARNADRMAEPAPRWSAPLWSWNAAGAEAGAKAALAADRRISDRLAMRRTGAFMVESRDE